MSYRNGLVNIEDVTFYFLPIFRVFFFFLLVRIHYFLLKYSLKKSPKKTYR